MWRVVCTGPGPLDTVRRVVDRGPFMPDESRAIAIADELRATGLYESVTVQWCSGSIGSADRLQAAPSDARSKTPVGAASGGTHGSGDQVVDAASEAG